MTYGEKAEQLFLEGYNCAQAVLLAFEDKTGLPRSTAARLASSFGGGMGRLREVCGALSGAFLVMGLLGGYESPDAKAEKAAHYAQIQAVAAEFRQRHGSILCREILKNPDTMPVPQDRTPDYYKNRPCLWMVRSAAELVENWLRTQVSA